MPRQRSRVVAIIAVLFLAETACSQPPRGKPPGRPPALVVVVPAIEREIVAGQTFVGTVEPVRKAVIGSAVDGRVIEFPKNEGDRVAAGEPLAQLLTDTISLQLAAAQAELEYRQQQLLELENGTRPLEVSQLRSRMLAIEARLKYLEARRERNERLFAQGRAISEDELEQTVSEALAAGEEYNEAKAAYDLAQEGPRQESIAQARAQVEMQKSTVEQLADQLQKHTVVSRFDGYVVAEHTEVGAWVSRGAAVAEIAALDEVDVTVQVVEQSIPYVVVGSEVQVQIPALAGRVFTGQVALVVPQADLRARTFPVKIRVRNEVVGGTLVLKSGMYARATLPVGERQRAVLVPKDAIVLGGQSPVVFVLAGPPSAEGVVQVLPTPVEVGVAAGEWLEVRGQLNPGAQVVVEGNERLMPGAPAMVGRVAAESEFALPAELASPNTAGQGS